MGGRRQLSHSHQLHVIIPVMITIISGQSGAHSDQSALVHLLAASRRCVCPLQDVVGGRFDAGQAFVGELSQVNIWDRVLKPAEIRSMANCSAYLAGNVVAWLPGSVEVFGRGASKRPLEVCQERLPNF